MTNYEKWRCHLPLRTTLSFRFVRMIRAILRKHWFSLKNLRFVTAWRKFRCQIPWYDRVLQNSDLLGKTLEKIMPSSIIIRLVFFCLTLLYLTSQVTQASPRNLCLRNCRICESMYGAKFEAHLCAHHCIRMRGQMPPQCTDLSSIASFVDPEFLQELKQSDEEMFWSSDWKSFGDPVVVNDLRKKGLWILCLAHTKGLSQLSQGRIYFHKNKRVLEFLEFKWLLFFVSFV